MSLDAAMRLPMVRASAAVLVVALAVAARALVYALRPVPIPQVPQTTVVNLAQIARAPLPSPADIQSAVENDVFSPDRSAPSSPYRMPGERDRSDAPAVEPMKPQVLGTAVATDGRSFATLQLGDANPVLARVGDKIGEWTVKAIGRGKVTLVTAGGTRADLSVTKPGT
jgi:hypothetical protein